MILPTSFWYNSDSLFLQKSHTAAAKTCLVVHLERMGDKHLDIRGTNRRTHKYKPSVFSTALQPMHVLLFWAKAIRPPTFEVNTVLQRVWSPSARWKKKNNLSGGIHNRRITLFANACKPKDSLSRTLSALLSPRMGSNILSRGLDSCCSR